MSEMVDRAVKALENADDLYTWDELPAEQIVRVVIEAMRNPTVAMMQAGERRLKGFRSISEPWGAMIDEALK